MKQDDTENRTRANDSNAQSIALIIIGVCGLLALALCGGDPTGRWKIRKNAADDVTRQVNHATKMIYAERGTNLKTSRDNAQGNSGNLSHLSPGYIDAITTQTGISMSERRKAMTDFSSLGLGEDGKPLFEKLAPDERSDMQEWKIRFHLLSSLDRATLEKLSSDEQFQKSACKLIMNYVTLFPDGVEVLKKVLDESESAQVIDSLLERCSGAARAFVTSVPSFRDKNYKSKQETLAAKQRLIQDLESQIEIFETQLSRTHALGDDDLTLGIEAAKSAYQRAIKNLDDLPAEKFNRSYLIRSSEPGAKSIRRVLFDRQYRLVADITPQESELFLISATEPHASSDGSEEVSSE